jgi:hypothetical protein
MWWAYTRGGGLYSLLASLILLALQGIIGFGRAILPDTPELKGASFAPGHRHFILDLMQLQSQKNTIFEGEALDAYSNYLPLLAYRSFVTSKSNKRRKTGCSKQVSHQLSVMPHNKYCKHIAKAQIQSSWSICI